MAAERKRPWFLVLALLGALALGTMGAYSGWDATEMYFVSIDASKVGENIADEHDRALVVSRVEDYIQVLDAEKSRGWPLAVATLLLGSATLLFAVRALGNSAGARTVLVQLVVVQAAAGVASHLLLRHVVDAYLRMGEAGAAADAHAAGLSNLVAVPSVAVLRATNTLFLVLRTLGSALVVVGLTRHRSRAYFEDAPATAEGG